jgi:hypothetical protein
MFHEISDISEIIVIKTLNPGTLLIAMLMNPVFLTNIEELIVLYAKSSIFG